MHLHRNESPRVCISTLHSWINVVYQVTMVSSHEKCKTNRVKGFKHEIEWTWNKIHFNIKGEKENQQKVERR